MTFLTRTADGKVVVYSRTTGQSFERWPVDAREMLASGDYTQRPPGDSAPEPDPAQSPAVDPVPHVTAANALTESVSPTGAPLSIAPPEGVSAAAPVQLPTGRTPRAAKSVTPTI